MDWTPIGPDDASLSPEVPPAVGQNRDGRLEVFAIDRSMRLVHTWEVASNTGQFAPWKVLPHREEHKFSDSLALARNGDGRLEVFAHAAYIHDVFHVWQTSPNNGWSEITPMGGSQLYRVQVAANADGRLEVFAQGLYYRVVHRWQGATGWWPPAFEVLETNNALQSRYVLGRNRDGRLEIFVMGLDSGLLHRWQTSPNGPWGPIEKLHDNAMPVGVVTNQAGGFTLFAITTLPRPGQLIYTHRRPGTGPWAGWQPVGGPIPSTLTSEPGTGVPRARVDRVVGGVTADGTLHVFFQGVDGVLYARQRHLTAAFEAWQPAGASNPTAFARADGKLEVFAHRGGWVGRLLFESLDRRVPIISKHSGRVLAVAAASTDNGAHLIQWQHYGGREQVFRIDPLGDGYYKIVAAHSDKVLDVWLQSRDDNVPIVQWDWSNGPNQQFKLEPLGDGYYSIRARHSDKVLEVAGISSEDGAQIVQWSWWGGDHQRFRIFGAPIKPRHSGKVLAVAGASSAQGAPVVQWDYYGGKEQLFRIEDVNAGFYRLVAEHSDQVMTVAGGSREDWAPIVQESWRGAEEQQYRLEPVGTHPTDYCFRARHSNKVLDVKWNSSDSGVPLIQYGWSGGLNQRFRL